MKIPPLPPVPTLPLETLQKGIESAGEPTPGIPNEGGVSQAKVALSNEMMKLRIRSMKR